MLSRLKWMFTSKQNRIPYVLEWYEKCIVVHPRIKQYVGRFNIEIAGNELHFVVKCSDYSYKQLWKVGVSAVYPLYTSTMEYPYDSEFIDDFVHAIAMKVDAVDATVRLLNKMYSRLLENINFNMTHYDKYDDIYGLVSLCPAGVMPLIDATEKDLIRSGMYEDAPSRKAILADYYSYIIGMFKSVLAGRTPTATTPYVNVASFEQWLYLKESIEKNSDNENELRKQCSKVLDDICGTNTKTELH